MALSQTEDKLILSTENNQLMKCNINLERASDETFYEFLIYPFHSKAIRGIDCCIKKRLVATCSEDKSVRIWDYEQSQLEICETFQEQAHCVAFHPSGFHIVVGFADRIRMMNVL